MTANFGSSSKVRDPPTRQAASNAFVSLQTTQVTQQTSSTTVVGAYSSTTTTATTTTATTTNIYPASAQVPTNQTQQEFPSLLQLIRETNGKAVQPDPSNNIYRGGLPLSLFLVKVAHDAFPTELVEPLSQAHRETQNYFYGNNDAPTKFLERMTVLVRQFLQLHSSSARHTNDQIEAVLKCFPRVFDDRMQHPVLLLLKREASLPLVPIAAKLAGDQGFSPLSRGGAIDVALQWLVIGIGEPRVQKHGDTFDQKTTSVLADLKNAGVIDTHDVYQLVRCLLRGMDTPGFCFETKLSFFVNWKPDILAHGLALDEMAFVPLVVYYLQRTTNFRLSVFRELLWWGKHFYPREKGFAPEVKALHDQHGSKIPLEALDLLREALKD